MILDIKLDVYYYVYGYVMTYEVRNVTFYNMPNGLIKYILSGRFILISIQLKRIAKVNQSKLWLFSVGLHR